MSWIITGSQKNKGLLDEFGGAAAAYSLRDLSLLRNAPVVRVRRSSDNAEADFTAAQVSDGSLTAWVGAGNNGFVRTWYDQSVNGRNANQTVNSAQPRIVNSGTLITENGKPSLSIESSTTPNGLEIISPPLSGANDYSIFSVCNFKNAESFEMLFTHTDGVALLGRIEIRRNSAGDSLQFITGAGASTLDGSAPINNRHILVNLNRGSGTAKAFINGAQDGSDQISSEPIDNHRSFIGSRVNQRFFGVIQETIIYKSSQLGNRAAIEANINAHYSIY